MAEAGSGGTPWMWDLGSTVGIAKDVKDSTTIKEYCAKYNLTGESVFDINLLNKINNVLIKTIEDGVEVYILVDNKNVGDLVSIIYIREDGTRPEELVGTVVEEDNKLYAKFTTDHFSTY